MDKIVICLLNWINNEINIKEDISELIENISWNEISLPLLFEFIIIGFFMFNNSIDLLIRIPVNSVNNLKSLKVLNIGFKLALSLILWVSNNSKIFLHNFIKLF
jgi:hypothetical protein